jgi:hypothetical protein
MASLAFVANPAQAALLTSSSSIVSPTIINFSNLSTYTPTKGPVQVGTPVGQDIVFTGTGFSGYSYNDYGLNNNGTWTSGRNGYIFSSDNTGGSMTLTFKGGLVSAVGGLINYAILSSNGIGSNATIEALSASGTVLESYNISSLAPISTPSQTNAGAFRGIQRSSADIAAFRLSNSFIVLDDLTFSPVTSSSAVPEPLTILGAVTAAGFGAGFKRKLAKSKKDQEDA